MTFAEAVLNKKHISTAIFAPSFYFLELGLVAAAASLFSALKSHEFSMTDIWLVFWMSNLLISIAIVGINDRVEADLTLMQSLRMLIDTAIVRSRRIGLILEILIIIRLLIWDGPYQLSIFFRNRVKAGRPRILLLIGASGLQMFVWTGIYAIGYDSFYSFFKNFFYNTP